MTDMDPLFHMEPAVTAKPATTRRIAETYEDFVAEARPVFARMADLGVVFTSYDVADVENLPDPPKPKSQWGTFIRTLHDEGVIEHVGWDETKRPDGGHSAVKTWRGVKRMDDAA